ncbi:MAG: amidohydrolase family protein [Planctomycetes bacterium]|nr:amidohydrolase family protein [Planctomycetota bacterium]
MENTATRFQTRVDSVRTERNATRSARVAVAIAAWFAAILTAAPHASAQVAVRAKRLHTMRGPAIENGVVLIRDGKIAAVGREGEVSIPPDVETFSAEIAMPGLIDARTTVGVSGILNVPHDQDQLERTASMQPELRAVDAYNAHDPLVEWVRGFGVTTIHTGHAPGELISGQTMIVKTFGRTVEDAMIRDSAAIAVTLGSAARKEGAASPGTRGKMIAMLRAELIRADEYRSKMKRAGAEPRDGAAQPDGESPARDLRLETLARALDGDLPLLVTADRAPDIASALRLAREFSLRVWLDSAAESYLLTDAILEAKVPVIVHPAMARAIDDRENLSFETAGRLSAAGIPIALQSGYEAYVPKTRVVLFEAGVAAAHGLPIDTALRAVTVDAARLLGIDHRVGSLAVGMDGDVALFDGDPFEYTSHCVGVVIDGRVVSRGKR